MFSIVSLEIMFYTFPPIHLSISGASEGGKIRHLRKNAEALMSGHSIYLALILKSGQRRTVIKVLL